MSIIDFKYATLVRYNGHAYVLGSEIDKGLRWARLNGTKSWIRLFAHEVSPF